MPTTSRNGQLASRRWFLVSLAGAAWAALGGLVRRPRRNANPHAGGYPALGRAYLTAGGAASRGSAFLEQVTLAARRAGRPVGEVVAVRRAADFRSGNTVMLDGWIVAESEALYCAGLTTREASAG